MPLPLLLGFLAGRVGSWLGPGQTPSTNVSALASLHCSSAAAPPSCRPCFHVTQIDGEVNILRGEREQAKDIIDDLSKKLNAVNAVIDEFQSERQVGVGVCPVCGAAQPTT